jgi:hypothetical protein
LESFEQIEIRALDWLVLFEFVLGVGHVEPAACAAKVALLLPLVELLVHGEQVDVRAMLSLLVL